MTLQKYFNDIKKAQVRYESAIAACLPAGTLVRLDVGVENVQYRVLAVKHDQVTVEKANCPYPTRFSVRVTDINQWYPLKPQQQKGGEA